MMMMRVSSYGGGLRDHQRLSSVPLCVVLLVSVIVVATTLVQGQRVTTFNIDDFGADYTGVNDSSIAIQAAVVCNSCDMCLFCVEQFEL